MERTEAPVVLQGSLGVHDEPQGLLAIPNLEKDVGWFFRSGNADRRIYIAEAIDCTLSFAVRLRKLHSAIGSYEEAYNSSLPKQTAPNPFSTAEYKALDKLALEKPPIFVELHHEVHLSRVVKHLEKNIKRLVDLDKRIVMLSVSGNVEELMLAQERTMRLLVDDQATRHPVYIDILVRLVTQALENNQRVQIFQRLGDLHAGFFNQVKNHPFLGQHIEVLDPLFDDGEARFPLTLALMTYLETTSNASIARKQLLVVSLERLITGLLRRSRQPLKARNTTIGKVIEKSTPEEIEGLLERLTPQSAERELGNFIASKIW